MKSWNFVLWKSEALDFQLNSSRKRQRNLVKIGVPFESAALTVADNLHQIQGTVKESGKLFLGTFFFGKKWKSCLTPVSSFSFQAVHTGMRAYIYNKNSVIGSQAEHTGMRTYYFSADTQEDMNAWIRAMNQAALMQTRSSLKRQVPLRSIYKNFHIYYRHGCDLCIWRCCL